MKTAVTEAEERLRQHEQELVTSLQGEMTSLRTELETCKHLFEVSNVRFTILVVLVVEFIKCFFFTNQGSPSSIITQIQALFSIIDGLSLFLARFREGIRSTLQQSPVN